MIVNELALGNQIVGFFFTLRKKENLDVHIKLRLPQAVNTQKPAYTKLSCFQDYYELLR